MKEHRPTERFRWGGTCGGV